MQILLFLTGLYAFEAENRRKIYQICPKMMKKRPHFIGGLFAVLSVYNNLRNIAAENDFRKDNFVLNNGACRVKCNN